MMQDDRPHPLPPTSSSSPRSSPRSPQPNSVIRSSSSSPPLPLPTASLSERVNSFRAACLDVLIGHQTHHLIPHSSKVIIFDSKLKVQHAFDGLVTHDINCFPSVDTRVLTDRGLQFLDDIEAREARGEAVLYACYDVQAKALLYRRGDLVFDTRPPTQLVCFASHHDGTHAALRVTPHHVMYAQVAGKPPAKRSARSLLPSCRCPSSAVRCQCQHRTAEVRMLACAQAGHVPEGQELADARTEQRHQRTADQKQPVGAASTEEQQVTDAGIAERRSRRWAVVRASLPVVTALRLQSPEQWSAFLELLGFWVGDGAVRYDAAGQPHAVSFGQRRQAEHAWLHERLSAVGLRDGCCARFCRRRWNGGG